MSMQKTNLFSSFLLVAALASTAVSIGCTTGQATGSEPEATDGGEPGIEPDATAEPEPTAPLAAMAKSTRNTLQWKRARALENGIGQALLLDAGEVCNEFGRYGCVDKVHLVALGGNDPYEQGLYEPPSTPGATTAVAVDRLLWAACSRAVEKERTANPQLIFLDLDLDAATIDLNVSAMRFAVEDTTTNLFRRFHARDPLPSEAAIVQELVVDDAGNAVSTATFATLACFAVGSTSETLFY